MWSLVPLPVWKLPCVLMTSGSTFVVNRFIMIFRIIVLAWLIIMLYSLSIVVILFFPVTLYVRLFSNPRASFRSSIFSKCVVDINACFTTCFYELCIGIISIR